jgi:hypothetical protein
MRRDWFAARAWHLHSTSNGFDRGGTLCRSGMFDMLWMLAIISSDRRVCDPSVVVWCACS